MAEQPTDKPPEKTSDVPVRSKPGFFRKARHVVTSCVMFVPRLFRRGSKPLDEVVVYSAHPAFYLWIVIVTGFALTGLVSIWPGTNEFAAWTYIFVLTFFFATILYDLSMKKLLLWVGVFMLFWLAAKYLENLNNLIIIGHIVQHFRSLNPVFNSGTACVISWLLLFPWLASVFEMFFNRCKKFTPNEISEYHFGEGSELTDRSGMRFVTKYRDVLETALGFGGGDLLAVDNHQNIIKRYENIVGLWFHWKKLDRVLHQRATVVDGDQPEEDAEKTADS